jgi:hypothetical protein
MRTMASLIAGATFCTASQVKAEVHHAGATSCVYTRVYTSCLCDPVADMDCAFNAACRVFNCGGTCSSAPVPCVTAPRCSDAAHADLPARQVPAVYS